MKVYVVMKGERGEGGDIEAIYANRADAKAFFDAEVSRLKAQWEEVFAGQPQRLEGRVNVGETYAVIACDTVHLKEVEVL